MRTVLLLILGAGLGGAALVGTDVAVRATGTEAFCTSCHEMTISQKEYAESAHYRNRSGLRASCGDCHIPHAYPAKLTHKTYAGAKDIVQHLRGVIDTPEKFEANRLAMAQSEWARMKANGSAECRHCHDASAMDPAKQKASSRTGHEKARAGNLSCVECHQGIAHREPGSARPIKAAANLDTDAAEKTTGARIQFGRGHFARDGKAFHYWDDQKEVPAVCARCHAATGIQQFLAEGKNTPAPHVKNAFACANCHADTLTYERHKVAKVTFASGLTVDSGDNNTNLCMTCHQGRESTASVNKAIAGADADIPNPKIAFVHVHYYPAGATLFGTEAKVAYEYSGKAYAGRFEHVPRMNTCTTCHEPHGGEVRVERCGTCHQGVKTLADAAGIRMSAGDFDGNGREEGLAREIENQKRELYAAILQYARAVGGSSIAFSPDAFPYWYADSNGNGKIEAEELRPDNTYKAYTPRLLQAVYNYTFALRDPGAAYHNGRYTLQVLYDSLESLSASGKAGVKMQGKVRP